MQRRLLRGRRYHGVAKRDYSDKTAYSLRLLSTSAPIARGGVVASVAEVKAAIDAALLHVQEGQLAVRCANDELGEAQLNLATAVEGSGHDSVQAAQAALAQAALELQECLTATLLATEQAETYVATL